jgi:hypothetical protein
MQAGLQLMCLNVSADLETLASSVQFERTRKRDNWYQSFKMSRTPLIASRISSLRRPIKRELPTVDANDTDTPANPVFQPMEGLMEIAPPQVTGEEVILFIQRWADPL